MRKILFLDIDGVLIRFWSTRTFRPHHDKKNRTTQFEEEQMYQLWRILKDTDCDIVISSNWRKQEDLMKILQDQFESYIVKGKTTIADYVIDTIPYENKLWKGINIIKYLIHPNTTNYPVKDFIVLDDELTNMWIINKLWRLIKTDTSDWLTESKANEVIAYLLK